MQYRVLITAGPTHEPIDTVRYLANRSSGLVGVGLAREAARRGHSVRLLLGPAAEPTETNSVDLHRFTTATDLQALLLEHASWCDLLLMAAAVADYRPAGVVQGNAPQGSPATSIAPGEKLPRTDQPLLLALTPTEDLLASIATRKRPDQVIVGFALEPRERLPGAARAKLASKGVDVIVANALETMESATIDARIFATGDAAVLDDDATAGPLSKADDFPRWLLDRLAPIVERRLRPGKNQLA